MKKRKIMKKNLSLFLAIIMPMQPILVHAEEQSFATEYVANVNESALFEYDEEYENDIIQEEFTSSEEIILENSELIDSNDIVSTDEILIDDFEISDPDETTENVEFDDGFIGNVKVGEAEESVQLFSTIESDNFLFEELNGTYVYITDYVGSQNEVEVPARIGEYIVQEIGGNAFEGNEVLTKIILPDTITKIGSGAFQNCSSLQEVVLPSSLTEIGEYAFHNCSSLTEIELPDGLKSYGRNSFSGCVNLESINYPLSLETGGRWAFEGDSKLIRIEVPSGVKKLANYAFSDGNNFKEILLPEGLEEIGENAFYECTGLTGLALPSTLKVIDRYALYGCSGITELDFSDSLEEIQRDALTKCTGLMELHLPDSIITLGSWAMAECTSLTDVNYPKNLVNAGNGIFKGCNKLKTMIVPEGVVKLPENVFNDCTNFTEICLPSTLKIIDRYALYGCSGLSELKLPEGLEEIGRDALTNCAGLTELQLPDSVTTLGSWAMANCTGLTSVSYPKNLASAGSGIFSGCTKLRSITVPEGVTSLPDNVFSDATYLRTVNLPSTLEVIGEYAFSGCKGLPSLALNKGLIEIKRYAFSGCEGLTSVTLPEMVENIDACAFLGCKNLSQIFLRELVKSIGNQAFNGCPVCLYVVLNSYAAKWAIDNGVNFRYYSTGNMDYSNYALDMSNSGFYTNSDIACVNNYITMYLNYEISDAYKNTIDNKKICIRLAPALNFVEESLKKNGLKFEEYNYDEALLTIPVTDNSGQIQFDVKVLASGNLSAYATFDYKKENSNCSDMLGMILMQVPTLTLDVPEVVGTEKLNVSGLTDPKESIKVFVDGIEVAKTMSKNTGTYGVDIVLPEPEKNKQKYIVRVAKEADFDIYAESTVILDRKTPVLKKFDMYYMAHESKKVDLLGTEGSRLSLSINPAYGFTFKIEFDNAETLKDVYVVGTKNGITKKIRAEETANQGEFIATGYFDETNKNYIPGTISLWYSTVYDGSEFTDDIELKEDELPDSCKNAEVDVLENTDDETKINITLQDGTVLPVEFRTYGSVSSAESDLLEISPKSKVRALSYDTDEEAVEFFVDKLVDKYGEKVKSNIKDKAKENGVVVIQDGEDLIYILWNGATDTIKKVFVQGGVAFWLREETCYTTAMPEAWDWAGKYIGLAKTGYDSLQRIWRFNDAREDVKNSTTLSDSDKEYALNRIDDLRYVYGALYTFKIVMSVAKPYIGTAVTAAYGPIAGFLVGVAIDYATDLAQNYLDGAFDYYAQGGKGSYFKWLIDPSGYVYEAVTTNRIQGARVTAYYKETSESQKVLWDASEDSQVNPLYSDAEGCYAWDTPEGYWQVVVEKDGYETWVSDWLSVPPIQENINASLISKSVPEVEWINVYEEYTEIHFTKYMKPDSICNITLMDENNNEIPYTISYLETETSEDGIVYADTFKLIYSDALSKGQSCLVGISDKLQSYSDVTCVAKSYYKVVKDPCVADVIKSASVDYGSQIIIPVSLHAYDDDTEITAISAFPELAKIVAIEKTEIDGVWNVIVEGRMPGETEIIISVRSTDIVQKIPLTINMNNTFTGFEEDSHIHSWDCGNIVKESTCSNEGEIIYQCVQDGCTETKSEILPINSDNHKVVKDALIKATLTANGLTEGSHCELCGDILVKQNIINYVSSITLSKTVFLYNGKVQKPSVKVVDASGKEISSSYYTVTYPSGCLNGASYTVKVTLKGNYSGTVSRDFTITLSSPVISKVENVYGGVKVTWGKVNGAVKYRLYRKVSGGKWMKVGDTNALTLTDKNISSGTKYYYTVRCISSDGTNYTSGYNSTGKSIIYIAAPVVSKVENLSSGIKVSWSKPKGAVRYRLFRKVAGGNWIKVGDTGSSYLTDKKVSSGVKYYYTVRCINSTGKIYTSGYNSIGKSLLRLSEPKLIKSTAYSSGIVLQWNKVIGATGYYVYRKTASTGWKRLGATTKLQYVDKGVKKGIKYIYTVRAYKGSVLSSYNANGISAIAK